jgi:PEP-CTERM motif
MKIKKLLFAASAAVSVIATPATAATFVLGDVFAAVGSGLVRQYSSAGVLKDTLNTGQGGFTTGMAFDSAGNLYVTNFSAGNVTKFNTLGVIIPPNPYIAPGAGVESLVFTGSGQLLAAHGGQTKRYSAAGALLQTYSNTADWIDLAADQSTLFYTTEGLTIDKFNIATNSNIGNFVNIGTNGGTNAFALRIQSNGNVIVAGGTKVLEYNGAGAFLGSYDVTGVDSFFALNLDSTNNTFWSGSFANNNLYRFTLGAYGANVATQTIAAGGELFGVAVFGEQTVAVPPVPEASTWAMMIAGFGLVGAAARRRRSRSSFAIV